MKINNILVLGSAGQIGTHLVKILSEKYNVTEWDIENECWQDLRIASPMLREQIEKTDFVMFLAFDVGGSYYLEKYQNSYEFISNNIKIMNNVFDLLKTYNKPFIFTSSQMSNMIDSPYGILKLIGEYYTKSLDGIFVKFWNVYGIEKDYNKSHVITDFINMAKKYGVIRMRTDGQESREFLYADDACHCLEKIMLNYDEIDRNKNLHISSFKKTKIIDLANIIAEKYSSIVMPSQSKDNIQNDKNNLADKYILEFWQPETELEDGINKVKELMG